MSRSRLYPPLLSTLVLALLAGLAQAADVAAIVGHVQSGATHHPVAGIRVTVLETGAYVITDGSGAYSVPKLAPGQYTLVVAADGAERARRSVTVADTGVVTQDFEVDANVVSLQSIQVLAQRASSEVARAAQQDAPNLVNLTTAEEIRKLPDVSAAEAIRRIPGISLETDTGEGRYINIRGLDADLNSTTFGGLRLPPSNNASPFGGGRAVAYDAIPTGLIGAITVTKTNTPDMDAEALGGTIEITPKTAPLSGRPFLEGHIGTGREIQRQSGITDLSLTAGTRFGGASTDSSQKLESYSDRPFSVVATASYYEDKRGINDIEAGYVDGQPAVPDKAMSGFEQRFYQYHRIRHGYGLDLGYQPDAANTWYLRAFDAGYSETVNRQRLIWNMAGNAVVDPANSNGLIDQGAGFDKTLRDEKEKIGNRVIAFGGKHLFDDKVLDYRIGYTRGSYNKLYDLNSDFNYPTSDNITYDNTSDPNYPVFRVAAGVNPYDPTNYTLAGLSNSVVNIIDEERSYALNYKVPTHFTAFDGENIKVGANARMRTRRLDESFYSFNNLPGLPLTSAIGSPTGVSFYNGHYDNGPNIDANVIRALAAGGSGVTVSQSNSNLANAAKAFAIDAEDVYALYGQYEFGFNRWSFIGGARVEATRGKYGANSVATHKDSAGDLQIDGITPVSTSKDYTNFFPSLQGRYSFSDDLIGRLAVSSSIARPGFNQVTPTLSIDTGTNSVTQGNSDLKPITATSLDASLEQYLPHGGIMSAGVFDKEISDYIATYSNQNYPKQRAFPRPDWLGSLLHLRQHQP